jgi:hypothetical protein
MTFFIVYMTSFAVLQTIFFCMKKFAGYKRTGFDLRVSLVPVLNTIIAALATIFLVVDLLGSLLNRWLVDESAR